MSGTEPVREASGRDAAAIAGLWTAAYVDEGEGGRTLPYSEADFIETASHGRVFIAEQGGTVVGVVALSPPGAPGQAVAKASEAELSRLVVSAPARHLGIGHTLLGHCHELAKVSGWSAIALWSRPYQTAAHRLYESLGYRRLPERDWVDDSGHERQVFLLEL